MICIWKNYKLVVVIFWKIVLIISTIIFDMFLTYEFTYSKKT